MIFKTITYFLLATVTTLALNPSDPIILFSIGDWGGANLGTYHTDNVKATAAQMKRDYDQEPFQGVLNTGDNFYYCGIQNLDDPNISDDYVNLFLQIDIPWISSLGNHDYGYNVTAQLLLSQRITQWYMPKRYYHTTINKNKINLHIIVLDSNTCVQDYINDNPKYWDPCGTEFPTCTPYVNPEPCRFHQNILQEVEENSCRTQYNWFEQQLSSIPDQEPVIVMAHHPIYELDVEPFSNLINSDKVTLYINGHTHLLAQYSINGQNGQNSQNKYITNGAASMVHSETNVRNNYYTWVAKKTGYMRHYINATHIHNSYLNTKGQLLYSFDLSYGTH